MSFNNILPGWVLRENPKVAKLIVENITDTEEYGMVDAGLVTGNVNAAPLGLDADPPKVYTQADMDTATASVRAEYSATMLARDTTATQQAQAIRTANRALTDYKHKVGLKLQDIVNEHDLMDDDDSELTIAVVELFGELGLNDYLPVKEWQVEVSIEGKVWVTVEAHSEDSARETVSNNYGSYEITQAMRDNEFDIDTWETTGTVEPY